MFRAGCRSLIAGLIVSFGVSVPMCACAAELVRLSPDNWDRYAPAGKEADAIYGDVVLANDHVVAVIAKPVSGRHANMTVRNVGGAVLDLTFRPASNDQLSAYYPVPGDGSLRELDAQAADPGDPTGLVTYRCRTTDSKQKSRVTVRYTLNDTDRWLTIETEYFNPQKEPIEVQITDAIRADFGFEHSLPDGASWFACHDTWWRQAYAILPTGAYQLQPVGESWKDRRPILQYLPRDGAKAEGLQLEPGASVVFQRRLVPAASQLELQGLVTQLNGRSVVTADFTITDADGPVELALVSLRQNGATVGSGRTDAEGRLHCALSPGTYTAHVRSAGRAVVKRELVLNTSTSVAVELDRPGYAVGEITDTHGQPIACKVEFRHAVESVSAQQTSANQSVGAQPGGDEAADDEPIDTAPLSAEPPASPPSAVALAAGASSGGPSAIYGSHFGDVAGIEFGPDTFVYGVRNLQYTPNGRFRAPLEPGRYRYLISHGPEYDVVAGEVTVVAGEDMPLQAQLVRTVQTDGWISADFHSHSTPSGDNTSSTLGRVLNLLAEHVEFAPCTEHNRIAVYDPFLEQLGAVGRMATCPGMELTGGPLPVNHHNAFPLVPAPHQQDGGGPRTDTTPEVQIERLKMWDHGSEKLVQQNHPHLHQIYGDRDLNGDADGGFRPMFRFMDVVEIHPLESILRTPHPDDWREKRGNVVFNWMQLLNLGYRVPGVVNTDAHYNFHGSGWLRNYIRSGTDNPALVQTMDVVRAADRGQIVVTNGPFLRVTAKLPSTVKTLDSNSAEEPVVGPGEDFVVPAGARSGEGKPVTVELHVQVQCANWLDINRVQVFVNGVAVPELNFRRATQASMFKSEVVRFDERISVQLPRDAHLIVLAAGEGLSLGAVAGDIHGADPPLALSNPIYVDVDGNGFQDSRDTLGVPLPGK